MIKKAIIFSIIFAFFCCVIAPDFVNAMGSSSVISDEAGYVILGVGIVILGAWYLYRLEDSDTDESNNQKELIKETVEKNISPSGDLVILRW